MFRAGKVTSDISANGLSITNTTLPGHIFYDGQIVRTLSQGADGSWSVTTHGYGNDVIPGRGTANQLFGPGVFRIAPPAGSEIDGRAFGQTKMLL